MKENEYILLLCKRLSGDITPAEASMLDTWIGQSAENERLANEYAVIWTTTGAYQKQFTPDLEVDFSSVQARIRQEEPPAIKIVRFRPLMLRVAAAMAFLVLALWGYSTFGSSSNFDATASAQDVEKQVVALSDGSQIWLRSGSKVQYAQSYSGKKERRVQLTGEAYFEIAHDPEHPFIVETDQGASVKVLGTQFNVRMDDGTTTVLVRSGKVTFSPEPNIQSPVLTANQKAVFDRKARTLRVSTSSSLNELAWQTGGLEFVHTPLSQVILDLEKYYNVTIALDNPALSACPYSALHHQKALKTVLEGLKVTYQLDVTESAPGKYSLSGGQCQ